MDKRELMKKFLSVFSIMLICCFCFVGCGVSGNSSIISISFDKQIFYVDEGCATKLDYKVFPSTANNFDITYAQTNQDFYELKDGVLTARQDFNSVQITVQAGDRSDSCYVVKKVYPVASYLSHASINGAENEGNNTIVLSSNASTNLIMYGKFDREFSIEQNKFVSINNPQFVPINAEIFNFEMVSSDPTVVEIVDSKTLQIKATGKTGKATITVYLVDDNGLRKTGNATQAQIDVEVVNPVSQIKVLYGGKFITGRTGNSWTYGESQQSNTQVISVFLVDNKGNFIENETALNALTMTVLSDEEGKLKVETPVVTSVGGVKCVNFEVSLMFGSTTVRDKLLVTCNYLLGQEQNQITFLITLS